MSTALLESSVMLSVRPSIFFSWFHSTLGTCFQGVVEELRRRGTHLKSRYVIVTNDQLKRCRDQAGRFPGGNGWFHTVTLVHEASRRHSCGTRTSNEHLFRSISTRPTSHRLRSRQRQPTHPRVCTRRHPLTTNVVKTKCKRELRTI